MRSSSSLGRPEVPPAFAFAPWHDAIFGSENVRHVARKLRDEGIPSSVIWTEDWRGGADDATGYTLYEEWDVSRDFYPDFEQLAADLHGLGYKFLTYNNTFLSADASIFEEPITLGHSIKTASGEPYLFVSPKFVQASLVDLTSPAAWEWTKEHFRRGIALGADGWMADFGEWLPTDAVLASGESGLVRHNLYPVDFQRLNREVLDEAFAADSDVGDDREVWLFPGGRVPLERRADLRTTGRRPAWMDPTPRQRGTARLCLLWTA